MRDYSKLYRKYLRGSFLYYTLSDEDISDSLTKQIAERDLCYTDLLKNHISLTKVRGKCKEVHKWLFFWMLVLASAVGIYLIYITLKNLLAIEDPNIIVNAIPAIITAIVSLVSTIIVIPVTIAKFLFNTKEDDNITILIQHTQDHDSTGISFLKERLFPQNKSLKDCMSNITPLDNDE